MSSHLLLSLSSIFLGKFFTSLLPSSSSSSCLYPFFFFTCLAHLLTMKMFVFSPLPQRGKGSTFFSYFHYINLSFFLSFFLSLLFYLTIYLSIFLSFYLSIKISFVCFVFICIHLYAILVVFFLLLSLSFLLFLYIYISYRCNNKSTLLFFFFNVFFTVSVHCVCLFGATTWLTVLCLCVEG